MPLTLEEQNALCEQNLGLVATVVRRRALCTPNSNPQAWEEAYSVGLAALVEASRKFNPDLGNTFATFACMCVDNAVIRSRLGEKKAWGSDRVADCTTGPADGEASAPGIYALAEETPERALQRQEQEERMERACRSKNAAEATVAQMVRDSQGAASMREMAGAAGVSRHECLDILRDLYRFVTGLRARMFYVGGRGLSGAERSARWYRGLTDEQRQKRDEGRRTRNAQKRAQVAA